MLWTSALQLQNRRKWCLWPQQHVQEFNSSLQVKCNNTGKVNTRNTQQKFKARVQQHFNGVQSLSNFPRNRIHATNTLQLNSMTQTHPQSTNVKEWLASSSGKATQSVKSKLLLPKTEPCVPRRELQFLNNQDPTHNFLWTLTTKSRVSADTCHIFTDMQSRPSPALMSQSMRNEPAQHKKLPQILLGEMFA